MTALGRVLLAAVLGYLLGFIGGMVLIEALSSNSHDKSLEAAMTGAFVVGPACSLLSAIASIVARSRRTVGQVGRS